MTAKSTILALVVLAQGCSDRDVTQNDTDDGETAESECALAAEAAPMCGNGLVDPGEICDPAASSGSAGCNAACLLPGTELWHMEIITAECVQIFADAQGSLFEAHALMDDGAVDFVVTRLDCRDARPIWELGVPATPAFRLLGVRGLWKRHGFALMFTRGTGEAQALELQQYDGAANLLWSFEPSEEENTSYFEAIVLDSEDRVWAERGPRDFTENRIWRTPLGGGSTEEVESPAELQMGAAGRGGDVALSGLELVFGFSSELNPSWLHDLEGSGKLVDNVAIAPDGSVVLALGPYLQQGDEAEHQGTILRTLDPSGNMIREFDTDEAHRGLLAHGATQLAVDSTGAIIFAYDESSAVDQGEVEERVVVDKYQPDGTLNWRHVMPNSEIYASTIGVCDLSVAPDDTVLLAVRRGYNNEQPSTTTVYRFAP